MTVSFDLPENIEQQLRREIGDLGGGDLGGGDLDRAAKEALAVDAFHAGKLNLGQFAEVLGLSTYEADGLLKQRNVLLDLTEEELERERTAPRDLLKR